MLQYESIEPVVQPRAAVIWLHGLGADGFDFLPVAQELGLPAELGVRFVFPHAPVMPVTINAGMQMRAWYDIREMNLDADKDIEGIRASSLAVAELVAEQRQAGIPADKILLAGFSQGGVVALHAALHSNELLCGVLALSTYVADVDNLNDAQRGNATQLPCMMMHGAQDNVVLPQWGYQSMLHLQQMGVPVEWKIYNMPHAVIPEQINDISQWLRLRLS